MADWGKTREVEIAVALRKGRRASTPIYETDLGSAYCGDSLKVLRSRPFDPHRGKVQLVFTSPPFPLNTKKSYGNLQGEDYRKFCLDHSAPVHPARMPSTLVEFFVKFLTDEGDTVLDPFAGSNTTGAVAQVLGRRWLSVEAEWQYAAHSIGRFDPRVVASTCDEIVISERDDAGQEEPHAADASSSSALELPLFTS